MRKEAVVKDCITWVGLDAHKDFIAVAIRQTGATEFVETQVPNEPQAIRRFLRKVRRTAPGEIRLAYEAGCCGYALQRLIEASGPFACDVVAPALIPRKPGERVKTDRRDARKLCELMAAGLLTPVHPPTAEQEAIRDLVRCREAARKDLNAARHRVSKFLLRRGIHFVGGRTWNVAYRRWVRTLTFENDVEQYVFKQYLVAVEQSHERLLDIESQLSEVAKREPHREVVAWLRCFRGIDTVTALGIQAELFDFGRFDSPRKLASYLGITPSEYSSGGKANRGSITKSGNGHVRRLLIEAAWHYRHLPGIGYELRQRRKGQPPGVIAVADKAQQRLCRRYRRLTARKMPAPKAVVAVARELACFLWVAVRDQQVVRELHAA
jgi:transposase